MPAPPLTLPEIVYLVGGTTGFAVAVKFTPVTFAPFTVFAMLVGVNEYPVSDGVTV
ncbi:MAG: hypothetical protein AAB355_01275 [Patescibacteria group bacterium]